MGGAQKEGKASIERELRRLFKEQQKILAKLNGIEKHFFRFQLIGFIKFLLVLIPLLLAIVVVTPFFREFLEIYRQIHELIRGIVK